MYRKPSNTNIIRFLTGKLLYKRLCLYLLFIKAGVSANHIVLLIDMYVNFTQTLSLYFFVCVNNFLLLFYILLLLFIFPSALCIVYGTVIPLFSFLPSSISSCFYLLPYPSFLTNLQFLPVSSYYPLLFSHNFTAYTS